MGHFENPTYYSNVVQTGNEIKMQQEWKKDMNLFTYNYNMYSHLRNQMQSSIMNQMGKQEKNYRNKQKWNGRTTMPIPHYLASDS